MENLVLSCVESRVENNRKFYGRFQLGPFETGQALTVGNAFRRTLLSELTGVAIIAVEIEGAKHEYSTLRGVRESVLDLLLNLKQIILTSQFQLQQPEFGFLQVQGPAVVTAKDLKLPVSIKSVDPDKYIATLSFDGSLTIKFIICQGKNYSSFVHLINTIQKSIQQKQNDFNFFKEYQLKSFSNLLPIDGLFMPVERVNFLLETYNSVKYNQSKERLILEVWTNGSIHPRHAIHEAAKNLVQLFLPFQETRVSKSVFLNSRQPIHVKRDTEKKITSLDISNLDLSLRPYTCLKRAKIHTVADLLKYSPEDLLLLKNFGKRSLEEVEKSLSQLRLTLNSSTDLKTQYRQ